MADLNLVNGYVAEGQRDFMCSNSSMDELQLAALLGKTLLEQNSELDNKLRRLQEFAEETLALNQSLTRQLTESRDSLQFSNKTCEQLEAKVDELERTNTHLQRQTASQQSSLDHKTEQIQSLEDELSETRSQNERLRDQISRLVAKNETMSTRDVRETRERSKSCHGNLVVSTETDSLVSELTVRLQNLTFQKEKAERILAGVVAENESLARNLERAEMEIEELTGRVTAFEESLERSTPLSTPRLPSTTTPTLHTDFALPSVPEDHTPATPTSSEKGVSLFNELDSEFSSLRNHYDTLVQGCTCSASLHHKSWSEREECVEVEGDKEGKEIERPFKELFEEMFATLKQTAQVADRLIERRTAQTREE